MAKMVGASASLLIALGVGAPSAFASITPPPPPPQKAATTTTLSASADPVSTPGSVRITAKIAPGVLASPTGSVKFVDTTTGRKLGKVAVPSRCLLIKTVCSVKLKVPVAHLAPGLNTITGTYSGNIAENPSSGSVQVTRNQPTQTTTCPTGSTFCVTNTDTSQDGTADASIYTVGTTTAPETISISFQTTELPCSTPDTGDPVVFSSTNAPSEKQVSYSVFGTAADIANDDYGTAGNVCYESPESFITAGGGTSTLGSDGEYYGLLPSCDSFQGAPPCIESTYFQLGGSGDGPSEDEYTENFVTTAADPRASN